MVSEVIFSMLLYDACRYVEWCRNTRRKCALGMYSSLQSDSSHASTVVRECHKGAKASQWKRPKFDHSPRQTPSTDLHKNWHVCLCLGRHPTCKIL